MTTKATKRRKYDAQIVLVLRRADRIALERLAECEGRSISAQVRQMLRPQLEESRREQIQA